MKKKVAKTKEKPYNGLTLADTLPKNRAEWLDIVVKFTKRAITDPPLESEQYLRNQLNRFVLELKTLKKDKK